MKQEPTIGEFFDEEEKLLIEGMEAAINSNGFTPNSVMTTTMLEEHSAAARNTLHESTIPVTIRIPRTDLVRLKG